MYKNSMLVASIIVSKRSGWCGRWVFLTNFVRNVSSRAFLYARLQNAGNVRLKNALIVTLNIDFILFIGTNERV